MIKKQDKCEATEDYIHKQNIELKNRIQELEQLLELNKEALRASINYSKEKLPLKQLVNTLYEENTKLKDCLSRSHQQYNESNSKLLICQQIVKAGQQNEKQLIDGLKQKIIGLKTQVRDKQKRVVQLQKAATSYDSENSLHLRLVEISSPNILSMKFHEEIQQLRQTISKKQYQLNQEKQKCGDLLKMNLLLTKQINQLKSDGPVSLKIHHKKSSDLSEMLQYHQKIMNISEESFSESEEEEIKDKIAKPSPVPKLELTKAKQIQEIIVKKINNDEKKKYKNQDNFIKNQQMTSVKKNLHTELIKNLGLQRKISHLTRLIAQLEARNERLLASLGPQNKQNIVVIGSILDFSTEEDDRRQARQEIIEMGREIYLNQNIQKVICGDAIPSLARDWSKSVMLDGDQFTQY